MLSALPATSPGQTPHSEARPVTWMEESAPGTWITQSDGQPHEHSYSWCQPDGAWPFPV